MNTKEEIEKIKNDYMEELNSIWEDDDRVIFIEHEDPDAWDVTGAERKDNLYALAVQVLDSMHGNENIKLLRIYLDRDLIPGNDIFFDFEFEEPKLGTTDLEWIVQSDSQIREIDLENRCFTVSF